MEEVKAAILSAATHLFAKYGFDKVSIRQISETAGTNSAMISYYFGGKQGLYRAVVDLQADMLRQFLTRAEQESDPRRIIHQYAETMLHLHEKNPYILYYLYREIISPDQEHPILQELGPMMFRLLASAIQHGIAQGLFREELDVFSAVIHLAGIVNAYFLSHRMHAYMTSANTLPDEAAYMRQAVDVFLRGIERSEHT